MKITQMEYLKMNEIQPMLQIHESQEHNEKKNK